MLSAVRTRSGVRIRVPSRGAFPRIGGPTGLCRRPGWRVAELVAEGLSNKDVAAELFVSVRAVEANLCRIYAKLGLRSRAELARTLAGVTASAGTKSEDPARMQL